MRVMIPTATAAGAALALVPTWVWAQGTSETDRNVYGPQMMWWGGGGWYGMILGPLIMILLLAVLIAFAVLLVRWVGGQWPGMASTRQAAPRTPLEILRERFARGEIGKEEFEERRRMLGV